MYLHAVRLVTYIIVHSSTSVLLLPISSKVFSLPTKDLQIVRDIIKYKKYHSCSTKHKIYQVFSIDTACNVLFSQVRQFSDGDHQESLLSNVSTALVRVAAAIDLYVYGCSAHPGKPV